MKNRNRHRRNRQSPEVMYDQSGCVPSCMHKRTDRRGIAQYAALQIQDYCASRGWKLVKVYEDAGISGTKDDRPALQSLLSAAKTGEIDAVIVRDLSRFGRSARDLLNNIQTLKDCSVTFISIKEGIDGSGPYGQFMLTILAAIAELEMEMIGSRMKENRLARWRDKRIFCGKPPYGYGWNTKEKRIEIVPDQGEIYSRVVREYLDLGRSLNDISIDLNAEGVSDPQRWFLPMVQWHTLQNFEVRDYCGEITVNKLYHRRERQSYRPSPGKLNTSSSKLHR